MILIAKDPATPRQLHDLARLVNEAVTQVRDISRGLHPVELECGRTAVPRSGALRAGLATRFHASLAAKKIVMDETPIQRYMPIGLPKKPCFTRCTRTGATKISIRLSEKDGSIRLEITDDGAKEGPLTNDPNDLASKTLQYRAQAIHGELSRQISQRIGTHITCTFPQHVMNFP